MKTTAIEVPLRVPLSSTVTLQEREVLAELARQAGKRLSPFCGSILAEHARRHSDKVKKWSRR